MDVTIEFQSSTPRRAVVLHAWEPRGETWSVSQAYPVPRRVFNFHLKGSVVDQRSLRFKFRFPDERRWESDDYARRIPSRRAHKLWAFDYSERVMCNDPADGVAPQAVTVRLLTRARYAGGRLYVWQPGTDASARFSEASRDSSQGVSEFRVPVAAWMKQGFHFKFIEASGAFEPEVCNRVWRPADGELISVKSGQATFWSGPMLHKEVKLSLLYPRQLAAPPSLKLVDQSGEHAEHTIFAAAPPAPLEGDARFLRAEYAVSVFPEAVYTLTLSDPALEAEIARPLHVAVEDQGKALEKLAVLGDERWLDSVPKEATVGFVFHPRDWTPKVASLAFELRVGNGPVLERVSAVKSQDGSWRASTRVPVGVALQARPTADRELDVRREGVLRSWRPLELSATDAVELHTVDAQLGFWARPASAGVEV